MRQKLTAVLALVLVLLLGGTGTALAATQTVVIDDPIGDVANNLNTNGRGNEKGPAYFDIVQAVVSGDPATFTMTMRLAAPVPLTPPDPKGSQGFYFWVFGLDTRPDSIPKGFPFAPGVQRDNDQFAFLTWDGTAFYSYVVDRTPLLTGGDATITGIPVSFNADRTDIVFVFDGALVGNPATFNWLAASVIREAHFGTKGFQVLDLAGPIDWP